MKKNLLVLFLSFLASFVAISQEAAHLPYKQEFNNADLEGWIFRANGEEVNPVVDYNRMQSICIAPGVQQRSVLCLQSGFYYSENLSDNWVISPLFSIDNEQSFLSWEDFRSHVDLNYEVRVSVGGAENEDFETVIYSSDSSSYVADMTYRIVSLEQFAGQQIRVAIHLLAERYGLIYVDNFFVSDGSPQIVSFAGPGVIYPDENWPFRMHVERWESPYDVEVEAFGLDEYRVDGDDVMVRFVPLEGDTTIRLMLTAWNEFGADTAYVETLLKSSCYDYVVDTFPFVEDFNDPGCWRSYAIAGEVTDGWEIRNGWATTINNGEDLWLVSPAIEMPFDEVQLMLDYRCSGAVKWSVYYTEEDMVGDFDTSLFVCIATGLNNDYYSADSLKCLFQTHAGQPGRVAVRCQIMSEDAHFIGRMMVNKITLQEVQPPKIVSISGMRSCRVDGEPLLVAEVESLRDYSCQWLLDGDEVLSDSLSWNMLWDDAQPGEYMIVLRVDNELGSDEDTLYFMVYDCEDIATFPYDATFDEALGFMCWTPIDSGLKWNIRDEGVVIVGNGGNADSWLISPRIMLPEESVYELSMKVVYHNFSDENSMLDIYVSTTGTEIEDFVLADSVILYVRSGYISAYPLVSLKGYRGDPIYLAFRFRGNRSYCQMTLSDIRIAPMRTTVYIESSADTVSIGDVVEYRAVASDNVTEIQWLVDNMYQSTATPEVLRAVFSRPGYHTIMVSVVGESGETCSDQVLCWVKGTLGVENVDSKGVKIFPNPTSGLLFVEGAVDAVEVFDIRGQLLEKRSQNVLDLRNFSNGVYYVKVYYGGEAFVTKVIKN